MRKVLLGIIGIIMAAGLALALGGCGTVVSTGEVGVRNSWGKVEMTEIQPGWTSTWTSSVTVYTTKDVSINLEGLKPKAADNLSLADMDVMIYYKPIPGSIAKFAVNHAGQSQDCGEYFCLGSVLVTSIAQGAIFDEVSKVDSLQIHKSRSVLETNILRGVQKELDRSNPATFIVTRVVITNANTDPSIEASIRAVVTAQKDIETKTQQLEVAKKQAEIDLTAANGRAAAQKAQEVSLSPAWLKHEYNVALQLCAQRDGCVMIVGDAKPMLNIGK